MAQGDNSLCEIHLTHGPQAKPLTCRQFPLRLHQSPDGVHVSLLLACDGYDRAREAAVPWPERAAEIRALLADGAVALAAHLPVMLDAGLGNLTRLLVLAHRVAAALAQQAGKAAIDGRDTTQALHIVYRSEAELTWLGTLHGAAGQVAHASPVP